MSEKWHELNKEGKGIRVRITDIGRHDACYSLKDEFVGRTATLLHIQKVEDAYSVVYENFDDVDIFDKEYLYCVLAVEGVTKRPKGVSQWDWWTKEHGGPAITFGQVMIEPA